MIKKKRIRIGNCSYSQPSISPIDWNKPGADLNRDWYVQFYYHDPEFTAGKGKFFIKKLGINEYKNLSDRRIAASTALEEISSRLAAGWNPLTGKYIAATEKADLDRETGFLQALQVVSGSLRVSKTTSTNISSMLRIIAPVVDKMGYVNVPVCQIKVRHLKLILDNLMDSRKTFGASSYNHYRAYLQMLFKELAQLGAVDFNPARELSKMKESHTLKKAIPEDIRRTIVRYFEKVDSDFLLFLRILFSSGARPIEVLNLKRQDIDLKSGDFVTTVRKGKAIRQYVNPIPDAALKYWKSATERTAIAGVDYIFGPHFKPGSRPCNRKYASDHWKKHVKQTLGIQFDLYALKHTALDEISEKVGSLDGPSVAAEKANHRSTAITLKHYLPGEGKRRRDNLRKLGGEL